MSKIFISYRRDDSQDMSRIIYEKFKSIYGDKNVFLDVELIEAADNWLRVIREYIHECDLFLIMIGEKWETASNDEGLRLFQPDDAVRQEIEAALQLEKKIIPVLLNNADMPKPDSLPASLQTICRIAATRVRSSGDYRNDIEKLVKRAKEISPPEYRFVSSNFPVPFTIIFLFALILALVFGTFLLSRPPDDITGGSSPAEGQILVSPTVRNQDSFLCNVEEFEWSPVLSTYEAGTILSLYGKGDCRGSVRASRFNIDGDSYGEDASAFEQSETWTMTPGTHTICFEITVGEWEAGARQCAEFIVE